MTTTKKHQGTFQQVASETRLDSSEVQQAKQILSSTPVLSRGEKIRLEELEAEISRLGSK